MAGLRRKCSWLKGLEGALSKNGVWRKLGGEGMHPVQKDAKLGWEGNEVLHHGQDVTACLLGVV